MRKLAIAVALASTALATPALARDKAWYVGVEGGAMIVEDIHFDIPHLAAHSPRTPLTSISEYGYDVDGNVGYDFGMFRLEAEVGYRQAAVESADAPYDPAFDLLARGRRSGTYEPCRRQDHRAELHAQRLLDFGDDDGIQGFVGGGVGVARVKADEYRR